MPDLRKQAYARSVDTLLQRVLGARSLRTCKVLLKPNLITATNSSLSCSEPEIILATARWLLDQGASVMLGDSPSLGSARSVLQSLDLVSVLDFLGVEIIEMNKAEKVTLPGGQVIGVSIAARRCDVLINLARVKAHTQTRVTMAVKNLYGCVSGLRKGWYHMVYGGRTGNFADIIVQIPQVLPQTVSMLGGYEAMHVTGPVRGKPFSLGILGASINPFALDTAFLDILGVEATTCPLHQAAIRNKILGTSLNSIEWLGADSFQLKRSGFIVPDLLVPIRFNPFRFILSSLKRTLRPSLP